MLRKPFCSFASFLIVSLTSCINKPDFLRDLFIFMISSISSCEIIIVVLCAKYEVCILDPKISFWIASSVADAAALIFNGIKTLLGNGLSAFFPL